MKRFILMVMVAACGNPATGDDDAVDGGVDGMGSCGDGACADAETPDTCGADCMAGGPVCGDGTCEGTESPNNCPSDCGTPACTAANDTCTGDNVCLSGACVAAFPRTYVITNIAVMLSATNQGAPWDSDGTDPDLYLSDSSGMTHLSATVAGLSVTFPGPLEVMLTANAMQYQLYVWDDDSPPAAAKIVAFACSWFPGAAELRARTLLPCAFNNSSMTVTINPK